MALRHLFPKNTGVWGRFGVLETLKWGAGNLEMRNGGFGGKGKGRVGGRKI